MKNLVLMLLVFTPFLSCRTKKYQDSNIVKNMVCSGKDTLHMNYNIAKSTATFIFKKDTIKTKQDKVASGISYSNNVYHFTEWHGQIQLKKNNNVIFEN